ncbi:MAG: transaldolase, partial [Candidatus Nanopelagicales bacterium]
MTRCLEELTVLGVSVWLDDLSRERLITGNLAELVRTSYVRGVTTNPAIFQKAISDKADAYAQDLARLTAEGLDVDQVIRTLPTDDVRAACDILEPVCNASDGVDGRVSIEVDPRLAHDTAGTSSQVVELWNLVERRNVLIKIPATKAGLPAITAAIGAGISVNVTLIFSVDRYREVVDAYLAGLEIALAAGRDLSTIHSVASFFVSRVDTEIDRRLDVIGTEQAAALRGKAGLANARLAWAAHEDILASRRWAELALSGALPQRPLWASTGVKDPAYDDTMYVVDLAVA